MGELKEVAGDMPVALDWLVCTRKACPGASGSGSLGLSTPREGQPLQEERDLGMSKNHKTQKI